MIFSKLRLAILVALLSVGLPALAQDDPPLVDGTVWMESSRLEKEVYLVGADDFLTVEYIVQQQSEDPPTDEQSAISEWWTALEGSDFDDMVDTIDAWYAANPESMETPVLVVIWNSYVDKD